MFRPTRATRGWTLLQLPVAWWFAGALLPRTWATSSHPFTYRALAVGVMWCTVYVHELAHATVMRRERHPARITVGPLFGISSYRRPQGASDDDECSAPTALAGPLSNLLVALLLYLAVTHDLPIATLRSVRPLAAVGIVMNLILGTFNLLPIAPLDGGRAVRALIRRLPARHRAWAGRSHLFACTAVAAIMMVTAIRSSIGGNLLSLWDTLVFALIGLVCVSMIEPVPRSARRPPRGSVAVPMAVAAALACAFLVPLYG